MRSLNQQQSVEFSLDGVSVPYRFKIWHIHPHSNVILVRTDSNLMPHLQVGKKLKMKYYFPGEAFPDGIRETKIKEITREEEGRFKGHCLVDLEPL